MTETGTNLFPKGSTLYRCGPEGCAALSKHWTEATYADRSLIVSQGDTIDDVFFVLTGRAQAAAYTDSGKEVLMFELLPGEAFGIFAATDGLPRSTSVIVIEETRIARMTAANFNEVLFSNTKVARAFIQYLVARIRHLSARMSNCGR